MQIPIHTNAKTSPNAYTNPFCRGVYIADQPSLTFTCPTRQAQTLTGSGGTVRRSLSRPTPSLNPPYQSGSHLTQPPYQASACPSAVSLPSRNRGSVLRVLSCLSDRTATLRDGVGRSISLPTRSAPNGLPLWTKSASTNSPPAKQTHKRAVWLPSRRSGIEVILTSSRQTTVYPPLPAYWHCNSLRRGKNTYATTSS